MLLDSEREEILRNLKSNLYNSKIDLDEALENLLSPSIDYWKEQVRVCDSLLWNGCENENRIRTLRTEAWKHIKAAKEPF